MAERKWVVGPLKRLLPFLYFTDSLVRMKKIYVFRLTFAGWSDIYLMRLQDYCVYPV